MDDDTNYGYTRADYAMDIVDDMEDCIIMSMGYEEAFKALSKALSHDTKLEMYEYIIRCYDL